MRKSIHNKCNAKVLMLSVATLTIAACDSSSSSGPATVAPFVGDLPICEATSTAQSAEATGSYLIAGRAADFTSGQTELRSAVDGALLQAYAATGSDIRVATSGSHAYELGRFMIDSITKYELDNTTPVYQYSVNGQESNSNPYEIVFVNETKAYIVRYGSDKIWIVNPSATSEANFKTGELDISAYDTDAPNASAAVLVDGKLYVLMERLESFSVTKQGYLAVFDSSNDTEIDTGQGTIDGLMGIPLGVENPTALQYEESNGLIYVIGRGRYFDAFDEENPVNRFTGGVVTVDPDTNTADLLLDDGDEDSNIGFFNELEVTSADNAYLLTYASFGSTTLRQANATTGGMPQCAVNEMQNVDITTFTESPNGQLWVGINGATAATIEQIDLGTQQAVGSLTATLAPLNIEFIQ